MIQPSEEQYKIITDLSHDIVLLAGAGTGKTFTIARKISYALDTDFCKSGEVLCLTFTKKAALEMKQEIATEGYSDPIAVYTVHGYCRNLLQSGRKSNRQCFAVCDEEESEEILQRVFLRMCAQVSEARLKKSGFTIEKLSQCEVAQDRTTGEYYKLTEDEGQSVAVDSVGNVYARDALDLTQEILCPFCHKSFCGGSVCPHCGLDIGAYTKPLAKLSLYQVVSAVRHARYLSLTPTQEDKKDYEEAYASLLAQKDSALRQLCDKEQAYRTLLPKWIGALIVGYLKELNDLNLKDYDSLIMEALDGLNDGRLDAGAIKLLIVDEAQDTSALELQLLERLFSADKIMLCGDFNQSIYGWRGAQPSLVLRRFEELRRPITYALSQNYRSNAALTQLADNYLSVAFGDGKLKESEFTPCAEITEAFSVEEEIRGVYRSLAALDEETRGRSCIMARNHVVLQKALTAIQSLAETEPCCVRAYLADQDARLAKQKETKDCLALLKLMVNPDDDFSAERLMVSVFGFSSAVVRGIKAVSPKGLSAAMLLGSTSTDPYLPLTDALSGGNCVVFDLETTGLDLVRDEAIQVAAIKIGADGRKETFMEFINATTAITPEAQQTHGYDADFIRLQGKDRHTVLKNFLQFCQGCVLVGHNSAAIDLSMLRRMCLQDNLKADQITACFDTMILARRFLPQLKNYKLQTLCDHFGIVNHRAHDALADVEATTQVLQKLVAFIQDTAQKRVQYLSKKRPMFEQAFQQMEQWRSMFESNSTLKELLSSYRVRCNVKDDNEVFSFIDELISKESMPYISALSVIQQIGGNGSESAWRAQKQKNGYVTLLTVHNAKGCEFDHVYLIGVDAKTFPSKWADTKEKLDEEKRVFYVAITRAKKFLHISYSKTLFLSYSGKRITVAPSPFLAQLTPIVRK